MTLYELTEGFQQLWDLIDDPEADEDTILDTLEAIDGEIEYKADGYAKVIAEANGKAEALKTEIDRLTVRKKTLENNVVRLKRHLQSAMELTGKTKFKTELFNFGIQKNPPSLKIDDETRVSHDYLIPQPPKIDTKAIKEALKEGFHFDWCHLEQTESLRIR